MVYTGNIEKSRKKILARNPTNGKIAFRIFKLINRSKRNEIAHKMSYCFVAIPEKHSSYSGMDIFGRYVRGQIISYSIRYYDFLIPAFHVMSDKEKERLNSIARPLSTMDVDVYELIEFVKSFALEGINANEIVQQIFKYHISPLAISFVKRNFDAHKLF